MSSMKLYMRQKCVPEGCSTSSDLPGGAKLNAFYQAPPTEKFSVLAGTWPPDTMPLNNQVGGHWFNDEKKTLGMLKQKDGKVLKPVTKSMTGEREIRFYEELDGTVDPILKEMRSFVPEYYGTRWLTIGNKQVNFIALQDLADGMQEPCIMDLKIGKVTWDPLATPEKMKSEKMKYIGTKNEIGLCIPGFQVYDAVSGHITRFDQKYGKTLTKDTFVDSIKTFLNVKHGLNRHLLVQILAQLWRILYWCRMQRKLRLYSSSILIVYDACRLRKCMKMARKYQLSGLKRGVNPKVYTLPTFGSAPSESQEFVKTVYSGPISSGSEKYDVPKIRLLHFLSQSGSLQLSGIEAEKVWHKVYDREEIIGTHSKVNNYEVDIQVMKENYFRVLNDLVASDQSNNGQWVFVKMIDFAHVFPADNSSVDRNYLEAIENLVQIFENMLQQSYQC